MKSYIVLPNLTDRKLIEQRLTSPQTQYRLSGR